MTATLRDAVSPDLRATLRALKLGQMLDTLPERLTLARQQKMTHADFLELVLADEVTRRESKSAWAIFCCRARVSRSGRVSSIWPSLSARSVARRSGLTASRKVAVIGCPPSRRG